VIKKKTKIKMDELSSKLIQLPFIGNNAKKPVGSIPRLLNPLGM
jgi:hypothetical protein